MKRFQKSNKIVSLVLAIILAFSVLTPRIGQEIALAAGDDLTGWTAGTNSTITGNPTDGWELSMKGNPFTTAGVKASSYEANIDVSKLEITMNLSQMPAVWMILSNGATEAGAWGETKASFAMYKSGTSLVFQGHTGSAQVGTGATIENFDFTKNVAIHFELDGEVWKPVINGVKCEIDCTAFVNGMLQASPEKTVVNFHTSTDAVQVIQGIKFSDKTQNLTGWTAGTNSTVTGNPTDGWELSMKGNPFTTSGVKASSYEANIDVSKLEIIMNLSQMPAVWMILSNGTTQAGTWSETKASFALYKSGTSLVFQGHTGSAQVGTGATIADFDFTKDVTITFELDELDNQVWKPVINGVKCEIDCTAFVNGMQEVSPDKTVINFHTSTDTVQVVQGIKFCDKTDKVISDLTGWTTGNGSEITGTPEDGWELSMKGNPFTTSGIFASTYEANIDVSKLEITMNLSKNPSVWMILANGITQAGAWSETKASFALYKSGTSLVFQGHTGGGSVGTGATIENFDFTKDVTFHFELDGEVWKPVISGVKCEIDCTAFVNGMLEASPTKTFINFHTSTDTVQILKGIKFSEKMIPTDTTPEGWTIGTDHVLAGSEEEGFELSVQGNAVSAYESNLNVTELEFSFNFSQTPAVFLVFSNRVQSVGAWSDTKACFALYRKGNALVFQGHTGNAVVGEDKPLVGFGFSMDHTFTFMKDGDVWKPAIDGKTYNIDCTEFVNGMLTASPNKTVVNFHTTGNAAQVIKGIRFHKNSGWWQGIDNTIVENQNGSWDIALSGNIFSQGSSQAAFYTTDISAADLLVNMDLSQMEVGTNLWLIYGNNRGGTGMPGINKAAFVITRSDETTLRFICHSGGKEYDTPATIKNFDFTKTHEFTFYEVNKVWKPVIDGVVYEVDCTDYVRGMLANNPNKTVVGFGAQSETAILSIKNISFVKKQEYGIVDWKYEGAVTVTKDEKAGYDIKGSEYTTARYIHKLEPQNHTMHFKLTKLESGVEQKTNVITISENPSMGLLPNEEALSNDKGVVILIEQKAGKTHLQLWDGKQVRYLKSYGNFDFNKEHSLTFVNEIGNWYVAFDGETMYSYRMNDFVESMMSADNGVYYRVSGWYKEFVIQDVWFAHTPAAITEATDWVVLGYDMDINGDKIAFSGNGYASWNSEVDLSKTSIMAQFKPANDGWVSLTVSDTPTVGDKEMSGLLVPEQEANAVSFIFGRQSEKNLRFSLYGTTTDGKRNEYLIALIENFDFDAIHEIRFVEKNGNYYIALDGQLYEYPAHDGEKKYITSAITDCLKVVGKNAYLRFLNDQVMGAEWSNISFTKKKFKEADLLLNGNVTVSVNNKNRISATGIGTVAINKGFNVLKDELHVQFTTAEGNWVALTIGDTPSPAVNFFTGIGNEHHIITILLVQQESNILRLSLLDNGQEKGFVYINYFDFSKTHTFSFVEHRGKYYLAIDHRMIEAPMGDGEDEVMTTWITKAVKALSKKGAYVRFVSPYEDMFLTNIGWKGMPAIKYSSEE